jgi:hypothetical protein
VLAIAAALGVPVERVRDAVFEQYYGYVPSNGRTTSVGVADFDEIVDGDPDLDAESKDLHAQSRIPLPTVGDTDAQGMGSEVTEWPLSRHVPRRARHQAAGP